MDTEYIVVRQPKFHFAIFILGSIFFLFLFFYAILPAAINKSENWIIILIFLPLLLLSPFRILIWYRYKITVYGDQITARSYFGRKKTFTVDYITTVKVKNKIMTDCDNPIEYITAYHNNEKLFSPTQAYSGYYGLVSYLKDKGVHFDFDQAGVTGVQA